MHTAPALQDADKFICGCSLTNKTKLIMELHIDLRTAVVCTNCVPPWTAETKDKKRQKQHSRNSRDNTNNKTATTPTKHTNNSDKETTTTTTKTHSLSTVQCKSTLIETLCSLWGL